MTYQLVLTGKFKKDLKRAKKRGLDIALLDSVVEILFMGKHWMKSIKIMGLKESIPVLENAISSQTGY